MVMFLWLCCKSQVICIGEAKWVLFYNIIKFYYCIFSVKILKSASKDTLKTREKTVKDLSFYNYLHYPLFQIYKHLKLFPEALSSMRYFNQ